MVIIYFWIHGMILLFFHMTINGNHLKVIQVTVLEVGMGQPRQFLIKKKIDVLSFTGQIHEYSVSDLKWQVQPRIDSPFQIQQMVLQQKNIIYFSGLYSGEGSGIIINNDNTYKIPPFPFSTFELNIMKTRPWYVVLSTCVSSDGSFLQFITFCLNKEVNILHYDKNGTIINVYTLKVPINDYQPKPFQQLRKLVAMSSIWLKGENLFCQWLIPTKNKFVHVPKTQLISKDGQVLQTFNEHEINTIIRPGIQKNGKFFTYDDDKGIEEITLINS